MKHDELTNQVVADTLPAHNEKALWHMVQVSHSTF